MIGQRFGRLVVLRKNEGKTFQCLCDCGVEKPNQRNHLTSGRVVSCGCHRKEATIKSHTTHGMRHTRTYRIWGNMRTRCHNPNYHEFYLYGGRGISVCKEWRTSFAKFFEDMGEAPIDCSLDRIDSNADYCKENCKWSTAKEQANNCRSNRVVECFGWRLNITQWGEMTGLSAGAIRQRLDRGWPTLEAITLPPKSKYSERAQ